MAELLLSEHDVLNGAAFVPANYLGGNIAAEEGRYLPSRSAQINGTHEVAWLNMYDSLMRRLRNASAVYVYKDSADTALQFSVKAFSVWLGGTLCTYAGGTAIAGLSAGNTRYIWADLSNAPTVTIGVGAAWPTTVPHLRIAAIAAPASGHWLPANLTYYVADQAARPVGLRGYHTVEVAFAWNTASPVALITLPAGARVWKAGVIIETVFNGSAPLLSIGDAGDAARLLATADVNAKTAGTWSKDPYYKYAAQTTVNLYITPSTASQGVGTAILGVSL